MSDSEAVDIDLDTFEKALATGELPEQKKEVSEPTPSATEEEDESKPEGEEPEGEDGDDTPEEPEAEEEEAEDKPKPKKRKNAQERIRELTADKYEMQRRVEALERALIEKAGQDKSEDKPTQAVAPASDSAPDPDAMNEDGTPLYPLGQYDPQFVADLTRHTLKVEREKANKLDVEEQQKKMVAEAQRELTINWQAKVEAAAERLPDLPEKFDNLQQTFKELPEDYGNFLASSIMMLDNGPDVLDYFADNLEEAKRVVNAGPHGAILALGRLDARFEKARGVEKGSVKSTQAPPPPPKNKGTAVAKDIRPDTDNLDDFEKIFYQK
jgi:hypothetical protein